MELRLIRGERGFLTSSTSSFLRTDEVDRADADESVDVEDSIYGMGCFSRKEGRETEGVIGLGRRVYLMGVFSK